MKIEFAIGPLKVESYQWWRHMWRNRKRQGICGVFRNSQHVVPGRWGFWILGLEFGSRNPRDKFGVWLKKHGLWPY